MELGPGPFFCLFLVVSVICGIPMMGLETSIGQFRHGGKIAVFVFLFFFRKGIFRIGVVVVVVVFFWLRFQRAYRLAWLVFSVDCFLLYEWEKNGPWWGKTD